MNGNIEFSDRRGSGFPRSWGTPPPGAYSEERAAWVRAHVETQQAEKRRARGGSASAALRLTQALRQQV